MVSQEWVLTTTENMKRFESLPLRHFAQEINPFLLFLFTQHFKKNGKWTQLPTIKRTITQGPLFVCEYSYEIEVSGKNIKRNQVSVSVIRDGKICREDFYYDDVSKKKASDVKEKSKTCLIV